MRKWRRAWLRSRSAGRTRLKEFTPALRMATWPSKWWSGRVRLSVRLTTGGALPAANSLQALFVRLCVSVGRLGESRMPPTIYPRNNLIDVYVAWCEGLPVLCNVYTSLQRPMYQLDHSPSCPLHQLSPACLSEDSGLGRLRESHLPVPLLGTDSLIPESIFQPTHVPPYTVTHDARQSASVGWKERSLSSIVYTCRHGDCKARAIIWKKYVCSVNFPLWSSCP